MAYLNKNVYVNNAEGPAGKYTRVFKNEKYVTDISDPNVLFDFASYNSLFTLSALSQDDLQAIEEKMSEVIVADHQFDLHEYSREEALSINSAEPLKLEIINEIPDGEAITTYKHGHFEDLCAGPHVKSTGMIPAFKLLNVAGAYWRGDESRYGLQRIYGTACESQDELDKYLESFTSLISSTISQLSQIENAVAFEISQFEFLHATKAFLLSIL